jgi:hypothetical protein
MVRGASRQFSAVDEFSTNWGEADIGGKKWTMIKPSRPARHRTRRPILRHAIGRAAVGELPAVSEMLG